MAAERLERLLAQPVRHRPVGTRLTGPVSSRWGSAAAARAPGPARRKRAAAKAAAAAAAADLPVVPLEPLEPLPAEALLQPLPELRRRWEAWCQEFGSSCIGCGRVECVCGTVQRFEAECTAYAEWLEVQAAQAAVDTIAVVRSAVNVELEQLLGTREMVRKYYGT